MRKSQVLLSIIFAGVLFGSTLSWAAQKDVLATVGTETITRQDLDDRISTFPAQYAQALQQKENKEKLLDQMINEQVLISAARKQGVQNTKAFKAQVKASQDQLLLTTFIRDNVENKSTVSETEVRQYYDKNTDQFSEKEERRASHVLVKTEDEAKDVLKQVQAGADFATVADQKSIDPSAKANHGDLGFFGKGQMVPEFEQAVFSLQKGQLSGIVKTQFGYHVIKLTDIQVRPKVEFTTQLAQQIKETLLAEKKRTIVAEYLSKLQKEVKVKKDLSKI